MPSKRSPAANMLTILLSFLAGVAFVIALLIGGYIFFMRGMLG